MARLAFSGGTTFDSFIDADFDIDPLPAYSSSGSTLDVYQTTTANYSRYIYTDVSRPNSLSENTIKIVDYLDAISGFLFISNADMDIEYINQDGTLVSVKDLWDRILSGDDEIFLKGVIDAAFGDYFTVSGTASVVCGDDVIILHSSATVAMGANQSSLVGIYGDVAEVTTSGVVRCGNDVIDASAANTFQYLIGDTASFPVNALVTWGNDTIRGGVAGEQIYGDMYIGADQGVAGPREGGHDLLLGGGGEDFIYGAGGNDTLNGGTDGDLMDGGYGNDTYMVDNAGDEVIEVQAFDGGTDRVLSSVAWTLGEFVENLTLTGTGNINGIGNTLNNILVGNSGKNLLDGLDGADSMNGGAGDDTYYVDEIGDRIVESLGGGYDQVFATGNFRLGANVEFGRLLGMSVSGQGNNEANALVGNTVGNALSGFGGNDTLWGDGGNDTLTGGLNQDRFIFRTALNGTTNVDQITDFLVVDDTIALSAAIFSAVGPLGALNVNAFKAIGFAGALAVDASDRIIHNRATGDITYDADGSGGASAPVLFAKVTPGLLMTAADFLIIA